MSVPDPRFEIVRAEPERRDEGVIVLTLGRNTRAIRPSSDRELIVALDRHGDVVWLRDMPVPLLDCRRSQRDTLLVMQSTARIVELNQRGERLGEWYSKPAHPSGLPDNAAAIPLQTKKLHHSVSETLDGKLVSLSVRLMPGLGGHPEYPDLMDDTLIVFDRAGTVEMEIAFVDLLDVERHSYGHTIPYWPLQGYPGVADWAHGNSVTVDPGDGGFVVSLRHQNAVVKLSRHGELEWILGTPNGWREPWAEKLLRIDGGRPFHHQHDAHFCDTGELLLFDNGTSGGHPPEPELPIDQQESHALAYRIEVDAMTATETWRYGGDAIAYSGYVGGVAQTPNGNRFIACTGIKLEPDGSRSPLQPQGIGSVAVYEVAPDGSVVFEARLVDPNAWRDGGWNGFRPQYLPAGWLQA